MSGYKTFVAGEEALAADVNSYLMGQAVARFASAAARTSQLAAPALNQLSMLDTRPGAVQWWSGSAWVDVVPYIQSGAINVTSNAGGGCSIVFPVTFAAAPNVIVMPQVAANLFLNIVAPVTASAFNFIVYVPAGTLNNTAIGVQWIAVGVRA